MFYGHDVQLSYVNLYPIEYNFKDQKQGTIVTFAYWIYFVYVA